MSSARQKGSTTPANDSAPSSSPDAAVRRAVVESRRELLSYLTRKLGDPGDAEVVLQRFVLRALERSNDLRDVRAVRGWLSRVLATAVADWQRVRAVTHRRERPFEESGIALTAESPDPEADRATCNCLHQILPTLKPEYADIVRRADLRGEPRDQIAIGLGTTVNNVTVRLYRGRRALKRHLEAVCAGCSEHGFFDCRCEPTEVAGALAPACDAEIGETRMQLRRAGGTRR